MSCLSLSLSLSCPMIREWQNIPCVFKIPLSSSSSSRRDKTALPINRRGCGKWAISGQHANFVRNSMPKSSGGKSEEKALRQGTNNNNNNSSRGVRFAGWANISHIRTFRHLLYRSIDPPTDACNGGWVNGSIDRSTHIPTERASERATSPQIGLGKIKHGQINR